MGGAGDGHPYNQMSDEVVCAIQALQRRLAVTTIVGLYAVLAFVSWTRLVETQAVARAIARLGARFNEISSAA